MSTVTLFVRLSSGQKFSVTVDEPLTETTVLILKKKISESQEECPPERQRLIYKGRILDDERTLSDYAIVDECTLHLVKGKAQQSSSGGASTTTTSSNTSSNQAPPAPRSQAPGNLFGNPFGGMGGMPQPDQIDQMMQNPAMQSLMENPNLMRRLMEANPQMRQLMDSNPQLREVMNDPSLFRQSLQMMRDPSAMQQMMRSQELAMSQIENMPGGFAALSSMYRNVQEPMMEAMSNQGQNQNSSQTTNPANQGSGAAGAAMPNPWGSPASQSSNNSSSANRTVNANASVSNPWLDPMAGLGANPFGGGGAPDSQQMEQTLQMLENPMVREMMDQFLSDPQLVEQMMSANPMMRQLRDSNPQAAAMFQNPEMMRQMMNPNNLRAMMQLQSSLQQLQSNGFPTSGGGLDFSSLLGAGGGMPMMGGGAASVPPDLSALMSQFQATSLNEPAQHPADRYRSQIQQLRDMGFDDEQGSLRALHINRGNLNAAVDMLIMGNVPTFVAGIDDLNNNTQANTSSSAATEREESGDKSGEKGSDEAKKD